jgi:CRISPR-associated exonuclease Cas4
MTPLPPSDDELRPIRALNDLLFCPRRCALHFIEHLWVETAHTLEGTHAHQKVHASPSRDEADTGGRVVRGLWLRSDRFRLVGVADLVEFHPQPYPIEYKRGRRRKWDNDEVQLCAQALCLEEMLGVEVPAGAVFHVKSKRRREVVFDAKLRRLTQAAIAQLHALLESGTTPAPVPHPKCKACSLNKFCLPELVANPLAYQRARRSLFIVASD